MLWREVFLVPLPARDAHLLAAAGSPENLGDRDSESSRIPWLHDVSRDAVDDLIRHPRDTSGDNRSTGGHRFQYDDGEILMPYRWQDHHVSSSVERPGIRVGAQEANSVGDVQGLRQYCECCAFRPIACNYKHDIIEGTGPPRHSLEEKAMALSRFQSGNHDCNACVG